MTLRDCLGHEDRAVARRQQSLDVRGLLVWS
jgi:hypothetical protein